MREQSVLSPKKRRVKGLFPKKRRVDTKFIAARSRCYTTVLLNYLVGESTLCQCSIVGLLYWV